MKDLSIKFVAVMLVLSFLIFSCSKKEKQSTTETKAESEMIETSSNTPLVTKQEPSSVSSLLPEEKPKEKEIKVTFIELGSVNCIPCRMMQPIMKEIEQEYADQVKVIFYDVWTQEGRPYAEKYRIRVIPTQIFLDKDGNEYFRHEGFFPKEKIVEVLKMQGVK